MSKTNDNLPESFCIAASATVEAGGENRKPRFTMVAYTGGQMRIEGFPHPVVVDLEGMEIDGPNVPIRLDHDRRHGVGHAERVVIENGKLIAEGTISRNNPWALDVSDSSIYGYPWKASIGADVIQADLVPTGQTVKVNGQTFKGPVHVVRRSILKEISFVDSGADPNTSVKVAAKENEEQTMDTDVKDDTQKTTEQTTVAEEPATQVRAQVDEGTETPSVSDSIQAMRAEVAAESKRIATIHSLCASKHPDIEAKAIEDGWDATRTELEVLRASRPIAPGVISGRADTTPKVIEAAACMATNAFSDDQLVKDYGEQTLDAAHRFRNIGVAGVIRLAAAAEGHYIPSVGASPTEILEAAASTMSLPGIMSNIANKSLLAGFDFVENAWRRIAKIGSVRDFKTVTRYRFTADMGFEPIAYGGEFKHGEVGEESYTNKADTYGKMFGIYREDIINDDLDALKEIPFRIGEGAALTINKVFWLLWLSNPSNFFSTAHKNYKTGANTALSVDGLTLARNTFSKQRRPGGKDPLGVRPKLLLVPASLEIMADLLMNSTTLNEAASTPKSDKNPHANKFEVVASDYLDNEEYTGSSDKAWYLLAQPGAIPAVEVVFLNGKQVPTVEKNDMVFNRLGIEFRGYLDFGIKEQDYRGALKMKGEA